MSFASVRLRPARLCQSLAAFSSRAPLTRTSFHALRPSLASKSPAQHHKRLFHQSASLKDENSDAPATNFVQLKEEEVVNPVIVDTITQNMKLETMTPVQSLTIHEALKGVDVLAQAKTGTGKTLGFLLPVVQNILKADPSLQRRSVGRRGYSRPGRDTDTAALIISPTRELAEQIADVARSLTRNTGIKVQTAVGGTQKSMHMRQMLAEGCNLLVGTPGRLKDILTDAVGGITVSKLNTLVLDEADRLLDDGFRPEILEIMGILPSASQRQTLMYSATISRSVEGLAREIMKPNLHFVKTVTGNETPTHQRVKQHFVELEGLENQLPTLLELINQQSEAAASDFAKRPFKAIVFINTTAEVQYYADVMNFIRRRSGLSAVPRGLSVFSIHSKLSQSGRSRAADMFRACKNGILLSSDVTARGMDFPNVTHVIQLGLPSEPESYVHRLGRTARAGAEGEGWLLVARNGGVQNTSRALGNMPLVPNHSLRSASFDFTEHDPASLDEPLDSPSPEKSPLFYNAISRAACRDIRRETGGSLTGVLKSAGGALIRHEQPQTLIEGFVQYARIAMDEVMHESDFRALHMVGAGGRRGPPMRSFGGRSSGFGDSRPRPSYGGAGSAYGGGRSGSSGQPPRSSYGGAGSAYGGGRSGGDSRTQDRGTPYGGGRGGASRAMRY